MSKMPDFLKDSGRAWVKKVLKKYPFTGDELEALYQAGSCLDQIANARAEVEQNGVTVLDRYQTPKANPACAVLRDMQALFFRCCKDLGIINNEEDKNEKP
jgi:phage terminase small subunit